MPILIGASAIMGALASGVSVYDYFNGSATGQGSQSPVVIDRGPSVMEIAIVVGLVVVAIKLAK
jgi:hypothetical protein